jgi:outer membrane protein assembly factor BamD
MRSLAFLPASLTPLIGLLTGLSLLLLPGCASVSDKADETVGWSADKLYAEAKAALNDGAYEKAVKYYEKLEARFPFGTFAQQAQLDSAYAYYKMDESPAAIVAADRFIRLHPQHPSAPYAWYLKGLANFKGDLGLFGNLGGQDMTERDPKAAAESFATFKELVLRFPESRYASDAQKRMKFLVNALAQHEVHVADYYFRRGAFLASINRAQQSLLDYPNAPANEKALFLIMRAYDALGMNTLRDDTERILRQNFPKSELYSGPPTQSSPWWKLW